MPCRPSPRTNHLRSWQSERHSAHRNHDDYAGTDGKGESSEITAYIFTTKFGGARENEVDSTSLAVISHSAEVQRVG